MEEYNIRWHIVAMTHYRESIWFNGSLISAVFDSYSTILKSYIVYRGLGAKLL